MPRLVLPITLLLSIAPAQAEITSAYTTFDIAKCTPLDQANTDEEYGGSYLCTGYKDNMIYFAEGDLRAFVAYGRDPQNHCAAKMTFPNFNSVGGTIEWRLKDGAAFAVIHRWTISQEDVNGVSKNSSWLMVNKLEDGNSCHMAVVEGAYPKANEKARELADTMSEGHQCVSAKVRLVARPETDVEMIPADVSCPQE